MDHDDLVVAVEEIKQVRTRTEAQMSDGGSSGKSDSND